MPFPDVEALPVLDIVLRLPFKIGELQDFENMVFI
jgi:hypothetical protein